MLENHNADPCISQPHQLLVLCVTHVRVFYRVEGGELFDRVVSLGLLEEPLAKLLFYQMVLGVKVV